MPRKNFLRTDPDRKLITIPKETNFRDAGLANVRKNDPNASKPGRNRTGEGNRHGNGYRAKLSEYHHINPRGRLATVRQASGRWDVVRPR